jgi:hypothetical protein
MPGKLCNGSSTSTPTIRDSRAFCEGRAARAAEVSPTNPYTSGTAEYAAWALGVTSKASSDPDGCCAHTGAAAV